MIAELNRGMRPEFIPLQFGVVVDAPAGSKFASSATWRCAKVFVSRSFANKHGFAEWRSSLGHRELSTVVESSASAGHREA